MSHFITNPKSQNSSSHHWLRMIFWLMTSSAFSPLACSSSFLNPVFKQPDGSLAVQLYPASRQSSRWSVIRHYPTGHLDLLYRSQSNTAVQPLDVADHWRRTTHPMLILQQDERLLLLGYDVVRNSPSGRALTVGEVGFDLFEITPNTRGQPTMLASGLDLGGIDTLLYGNTSAEGTILCGDNRCVTITPAGQINRWKLETLAPYEFVEVAFSDINHDAYAIVRSRHDDRLPLTSNDPAFQLARLTPAGADLTPLADPGIPWQLTLKKGQPTWHNARHSTDLQQLLWYDLSRMPHQGLMEFGSHNLEGRVAWSQVYYLNGFITLLTASNHFNYLDTVCLDSIKARVVAELELLAQLANSEYPNFHSKRYSLDREPLLFALHLGRIQRTLARACEARLVSVTIQQAMRYIQQELWMLSHTLETKNTLHWQGCIVQTLSYRKGCPFWADGINTPYNYISGYIEGLLAGSHQPEVIQRAAHLAQPILTLELSPPFSKSWLYWWGPGQAGWQRHDYRSLNTPQWAGNQQGTDLAHITYRSMDAMALIALFKADAKAVPAALIDHFHTLVTNGWLLPSVNEALLTISKPAQLSPTIAYRYSRSAAPWELQSQIWALATLSKTRP